MDRECACVWGVSGSVLCGADEQIRGSTLIESTALTSPYLLPRNSVMTKHVILFYRRFYDVRDRSSSRGGDSVRF